jgi:hypothetical protein
MLLSVGVLSFHPAWQDFGKRFAHQCVQFRSLEGKEMAKKLKKAKKLTKTMTLAKKDPFK